MKKDSEKLKRIEKAALEAEIDLRQLDDEIHTVDPRHEAKRELTTNTRLANSSEMDFAEEDKVRRPLNWLLKSSVFTQSKLGSKKLTANSKIVSARNTHTQVAKKEGREISQVTSIF